MNSLTMFRDLDSTHRVVKQTGMLIFALAALWLSSAWAAEEIAPAPATNARAEQARLFQPETAAPGGPRSGLSLDQVPSSPGDPDLGEQVLLRQKEKATPFKLFADASGFYTSNAALTDSHTVDDFFFVAQAGVSYQARIVGGLYGEVTVRQATFRYAEFDHLDFDSLNAGVGLTYLARPLWGLAFSVRYNFNRLTDGSQHDEFFKNHTLTLGVQKTFELTKAHYAYVGYSSVLGWSDPVAPERDEHGIYLGYHVNLTRAISADAAYRIALFDYANDREDWNQSLTLAVKWDINRWFNVSASVSGGLNRSDRDVFNYKVFNTGVGLAGAISF